MPYAELWMGTHSSGPSVLEDSKTLLKEYLSDNSKAVGAVPVGYATDDLPFLLKVLSVNTALSIQAHPDKALAPLLHERNPEAYKDSNHKPEMAIALTEFECLCGFRSLAEIHSLLSDYPELSSLLEQSGFAVDRLGAALDSKALLKQLFSAYMTCTEDVAQMQLRLLVERLAAKGSADSTSRLDQLLLRLHQEYPGDRGVFAAVLLNYLTLQPGQSFFIGANEPHAYLRGDCVECMALSDNVVRAGLTPKFKDVDTLCNMLTYSSGAPAMLQPLSLDEYTSVFRPPGDICAEFEVEVTDLPAAVLPYTMLSGDYASILVVVGGKGATIAADGKESLELSLGSVIFVAAGVAPVISVSEGSGVKFYRAHVNLSV